MAAVIAAGYFYFQGGPTLTDKDTLVLAEFSNTTGDPVFDETLRQGLRIQLAQSPFLSLISEDRVQQVLRLMDQPPDARLTPKLAQEVCERTGSAAVLDGSITSLGSQYVLGLRATNCHTGDLLDEEQVQAAKKEDVLSSLSQIAREFRARVGESLATVERHSVPLAEATTSSLEALKAFSVAFRVLSASGDGAALPSFKRAVEIDPGFAMAHAALGLSYYSIGDSADAADSARKAWELRESAGDAEKFLIAAQYDAIVTGNLEKARQTCELWAQIYPRDQKPFAFLAGMIYNTLGKYEKAVESAGKVIEIDPDFGIGYYQLSFNNAYLGRLDEAERALERAAERKLENPGFVIQAYDIAFIRDDQAAMEREAARGHNRTDVDELISSRESFVLAYSGRAKQARSMSRRAADLARQAGNPEGEALYEAGAAVWESLLGNAREARTAARAALELSKARDVEYGAAFALALAGDSSQAREIADDLEKRFPEDTAVRLNYLPVLRARLAMNRGEPAQALRLLEAAAPYELGTPPSCAVGFFGMLYPIYLRGEAYLATQQGPEAAREFQKILDHRGIVVSDPIGALAHLQLGRALVLSGDKANAQAAFDEFLDLWRDADSDIAILGQAKTERTWLLRKG